MAAAWQASEAQRAVPDTWPDAPPRGWPRARGRWAADGCGLSAVRCQDGSRVSRATWRTHEGSRRACASDVEAGNVRLVAPLIAAAQELMMDELLDCRLVPLLHGVDSFAVRRIAARARDRRQVERLCGRREDGCRPLALDACLLHPTAAAGCRRRSRALLAAATGRMIAAALARRSRGLCPRWRRRRGGTGRTLLLLHRGQAHHVGRACALAQHRSL